MQIAFICSACVYFVLSSSILRHSAKQTDIKPKFSASGALERMSETPSSKTGSVATDYVLSGIH